MDGELVPGEPLDRVDAREDDDAPDVGRQCVDERALLAMLFLAGREVRFDVRRQHRRLDAETPHPFREHGGVARFVAPVDLHGAAEPGIGLELAEQPVERDHARVLADAILREHAGVRLRMAHHLAELAQVQSGSVVHVAHVLRSFPGLPPSASSQDRRSSVMESVQVDGFGLEQPLQEESVEGGNRDHRHATALSFVLTHAAQPALVQLADVAVDLLQARAQLGAAFDALEDQVENQTPELGALAQRLREEPPGGLVALLDGGQLEDVPHGTARDLVEDALRHAQQQLFLGAEVPEDGRLGDAHLLGHGVERRALDAARGQQAQRGLDDGSLGADTSLLPGTGDLSFGPILPCGAGFDGFHN